MTKQKTPPKAQQKTKRAARQRTPQATAPQTAATGDTPPPAAADAQHVDIAIIGGGIPGLTLAVLLGQLGVSVAVADAMPAHLQDKIMPESRTSALMARSVNILQFTNAWATCRPLGGLMTSLAVIDDSRRPPVTTLFEAGDIGQDYFAINMPNAPLRHALWQEAAALDSVTLHAGARLRSYTADARGVTAHFDGAPPIHARLLVGADGRASTVRTQAGIPVWERDYDQTALTCLIRHTRSHKDTSTEFHRPGGPFTLVPLPDQRASVVWVEKSADAAAFARMSQSAVQQALEDRAHGLLGKITLDSPLSHAPLIALKARRLTAPRVALIAEAAHVLSPVGAQGLNLSLRDAATLAELVADALRLGQDPGAQAVLRAYEARRAKDIALRLHGTDTLTRMVSTAQPFVKDTRRWGLKTLESLPFLRDFIMREGMAPHDPESRLAVGRPL